MNLPSKLTKKQRKGLAFRQKGTIQPKDVPEEDASEQEQQVEKAKPSSSSTSKRKRDDDEVASGERDSKKAKAITASIEPSKDKKGTSRFILFVGNLRYTTAKERIEEHFSKCDPPPTVRLITPKGSQKSKGCAFVEFTHPNALQQGLKLHHSELEGRKLNVELTAGGGGKGADRLKRLRERNTTLNVQRNKQQGRPNDSERNQAPAEAHVEGSRVSLTSGTDLIPRGKKTWTVGGVKAKRKRGGKRQTTKETSQPTQPYSLTGANAIAVG